jgi:hypothetical protein
MNIKGESNPIGRREFIRKSSLAVISVPVAGNFTVRKENNTETVRNKTVKPEWRNKQDKAIWHNYRGFCKHQ